VKSEGWIVKDEKRVGLRFSKAAMAAPRRSMKRLLHMLAWLLAAASATAWSANALNGADLYRQHCSACHGVSGRPVLPTAPDFTQHTTLLKPDLALLASIRRGRGAMPAYEGVLRDAEILDVVAHLRTLRK
jgi:cytochrome c6